MLGTDSAAYITSWQVCGVSKFPKKRCWFALLYREGTHRHLKFLNCDPPKSDEETEKQIKDRMGQHWMIGGSGAHKWFNCILNPHLEKVAGDMEKTPEMEEGARLHAELEKAILEPGYAIQDGIISKALTEIRALRARLGGDANIYYSATEQPIDWPEFPDVGGTPDWWGITRDKRGGVADFKSRGTLGVEEQLKVYSLLLFLRARRSEIHLDSIVAQCLCANEPTELVFNREELLALEEEMTMHIGFIVSEGASARGTTGPWCDRCRGKGICPAYLQEIAPATEALLQIEKKGKEYQVARASDDTLSLILKHRAQIEGALKSAVAYGKKRAMESNPIEQEDGWWDLKPGNRVRIWAPCAKETLLALGVSNPTTEEVKPMKTIQGGLPPGVKLPNENEEGFAKFFTLRQNNPSLIFRVRGQEMNDSECDPEES